MGKRGPAPKPTKIKQLQGNPGKRALNDREPQPDTTKPRRPRWLSDDAKPLWNQLAPKLHEAGLLTQIDDLALGMLCETYAQYLEARESVARFGLVAESDKGSVYQHPAVGVMNKARGDLLRLLKEFGMTPSSRSGIKLPGGGGDEESLADMLFQAVNDE